MCPQAGSPNMGDVKLPDRVPLMRAAVLEAIRQPSSAARSPPRLPRRRRGSAGAGPRVSVAATGNVWTGAENPGAAARRSGPRVLRRDRGDGPRRGGLGRRRPGGWSPYILGLGACPDCGAGHRRSARGQVLPGFTGREASRNISPCPHAAAESRAVCPRGLDPALAAVLGWPATTAWAALTGRGGCRAASGLAVSEAAVWAGGLDPRPGSRGAGRRGGRGVPEAGEARDLGRKPL